MTDIEWPEGATHRIESTFVRLVDDEPLDFLSNLKLIEMWDGNEWLKARIDKDAMIEELKKEPEATKSEAEPYKPEVGEWFIASGGAKMAFVGIDSGNAYICEMDGGVLLRLYDFAGCQPIKSERDQFIERAMKATSGDNSDSTLIDLFDDMYQDGFEAPKDNGARFADEN